MIDGNLAMMESHLKQQEDFSLMVMDGLYPEDVVIRMADDYEHRLLSLIQDYRRMCVEARVSLRVLSMVDSDLKEIPDIRWRYLVRPEARKAAYDKIKPEGQC